MTKLREKIQFLTTIIFVTEKSTKYFLELQTIERKFSKWRLFPIHDS